MTGRVPSTEASASVEAEDVTLVVVMCSPNWKLSELHTITIFNGGFIPHV